MPRRRRRGICRRSSICFELLGIYPAPAVKEPEAEDSNDLARVLLNRFDFPYKGPGDEEAAQGPKDGELVPAGVKDDSVE